MLPMSQSDDQSLAAVLLVINESLKALTDSVEKLHDSQVEIARNAYELSAAMQESFGKVCQSQLELGELLVKLFSELSEKLGLPSSVSPSSSSSPKQGGGTVQ